MVFVERISRPKDGVMKKMTRMKKRRLATMQKKLTSDLGFCVSRLALTIQILDI